MSNYRNLSEFAISMKTHLFKWNSPVLSNVHILVDSLGHSVLAPSMTRMLTWGGFLYYVNVSNCCVPILGHPRLPNMRDTTMKRSRNSLSHHAPWSRSTQAVGSQDPPPWCRLFDPGNSPPRTAVTSRCFNFLPWFHLLFPDTDSIHVVFMTTNKLTTNRCEARRMPGTSTWSFFSLTCTP